MSRAFAIVGLVLIACSRGETPPSSANERSAPAANSAYRVLADTLVIGKPRWTSLSDSVIWITDASGDPFIHAIDRMTGRVIVSRGAAGNGPGDFQNASAILADDDGRGAWVYDMTLSRVTHLALSARDKADRQVYQLLPALGLVSMAPYRGGFWGWSRDSSTRFVQLSDSGTVVFRRNERPLGGDSVSLRVRLTESGQNSLCSSPDGRRFVVAYRFVDRIEIRDSVAKLISIASKTGDSTLAFARSASGALRRQRSRLSYLMCAATDSAIYALYNGTSFGPDGELTGDREARTILKLDWDGRVTATSTTPVGVSRIAVDERAGVVVGTSESTGQVIEFPLSTQAPRPRR